MEMELLFFFKIYNFWHFFDVNLYIIKMFTTQVLDIHVIMWV